MPTLRRLDDGTRYYYLTFRQWAAALAGLALLYGAVRVSPLSHKWTFTVVLLTLSALTAVILPLTGNALGLDRYLAAIIRWAVGPRYFTPLETLEALHGGVVLSTAPVGLLAPPPRVGVSLDAAWELDDVEQLSAGDA
jgi:small basic protein